MGLVKPKGPAPDRAAPYLPNDLADSVRAAEEDMAPLLSGGAYWWGW